MTTVQTINFDNEMKALSQGVYKGNEIFIPKYWMKIAEHDKKSGFHAEAFYKDGIIAIAIRGTDARCCSFDDLRDSKNDFNNTQMLRIFTKK